MSRKAFVSGAFDLLHSGHVAFLTEAALHGDLYVCIGNDECVFTLKGRYPVNPQDERKYLIDSLRCVRECRISRGMGLLDFVGELRDIRPDVFVVNEDGAHESKAALCRELGIEYLVLRRLPHGGLPARSTTALRNECTIPFRIDLAGGWLDQPFVSVYHPGAVLTISIEPTHEFDSRSGMASSTRNKAIELWRTALPQGNKEQVAKILFSYENPPGTKEVAGSQDSIGIVYPGLNRLDYDGAYWPYAIESVHDEGVLAWLERRLHLVPLGPRASEFSVLADTRVTPAGAQALAASAEDCWRAILAMDIEGFGRAFTASFDAQVAMFPNMVNQAVRDLVGSFRDRARGWKLSGAGGGGYLILVSDQFVPDAIQVRIRRHYALV
jgi:cytidyltransferase-like protein